MKKIIKYIWLIVFLAFYVSLSVTAAQPEIKSKTAVLIDGDTGQVLVEKNMNVRMSPASITKIMTAVLALEKGSLNGIVTMSYDAVFSIGRDTSHIALDDGESLTLEQALYALAIASANDAANGIAEHTNGTMEAFAVRMTERAKSAGAVNTNFTNAHGLPDDNHYTTAYDMVKIMAAAIKIPAFVNIFGAPSYEMPPTNKQPETRIFNRKNSMLIGEYKYEGVIAEKTGWTPDAGFTYAAAAKRGGRTLIAVLMKSPDEAARWSDTAALFDYGFEEFTPLSFSAEEIKKESYAIEDADNAGITADLIPSSGFSCLIHKTLGKEDIEIKYILSTGGGSGKMQGNAVFAVKSESAAQDMYSELGKVDVQIRFNGDKEAIPANVGLAIDGEQPESLKKRSVLSVILEIIGGIFVVLMLAVLVLYVRRNMIIRKRKRARYNNYYRNYGRK